MWGGVCVCSVVVLIDATAGHTNTPRQVVQETVLALGMVLPPTYLVYKCESWIDMFVLWVDGPDLHVKVKAASALANIAHCGRYVARNEPRLT